MARVGIDLLTWDVGSETSSPQEYMRLVVSRVLESWQQGADIVLLPEYTWMGLERFITAPDKMAGVANLFWQKLWPEIKTSLKTSDKAVVLGTVPALLENGTLRNRAPILLAGKICFQDKLQLTPWEKSMTHGDVLNVWTFRELRFAVLICLDIEVPELAVALRNQQVDLILVPSATENVLGVERIGRCASARAVELGCHVGVAHLVGQMDSELVDENMGRLAWFSPSQSTFQDLPREDVTESFSKGHYKKQCILETSLLKRMRARRVETNPAALTPKPFAVELIEP